MILPSGWQSLHQKTFNFYPQASVDLCCSVLLAQILKGIYGTVVLFEDLDLNILADTTASYTTEVNSDIPNISNNEIFFPVYALYCLDFTKLLLARQLESGILGEEIELDHTLGIERIQIQMYLKP